MPVEKINQDDIDFIGHITCKANVKKFTHFFEGICVIHLQQIDEKTFEVKIALLDHSIFYRIKQGQTAILGFGQLGSPISCRTYFSWTSDSQEDIEISVGLQKLSKTVSDWSDDALDFEDSVDSSDHDDNMDIFVEPGFFVDFMDDEDSDESL